MTCDKRKFEDRRRALEFARVHRKEHGRQRAYQCEEPECRGLWHLTSQSSSSTTYYRDARNKRKRQEQRNERRYRYWFW